MPVQAGIHSIEKSGATLIQTFTQTIIKKFKADPYFWLLLPLLLYIVIYSFLSGSVFLIIV